MILRALLMNEAGAADGMGGGGGGEPSDSGVTPPAPENKGDAAAAKLAGQTAANDNDTDKSESGSSKPKTPAQKHKVRRMGQDVEMTLEELLDAASDNHPYELDIGKDKDGNALKRALKLPELVRQARLGEAAMAKMEQAAELRKQVEEARSRGKQDVGWYMREHLGVEDPEDWAVKMATARLQRQRELHELLEQGNVVEYNKRVTQQERERVERERALEEQRRQQAEAQKAAQERAQAIDEAFPAALKAAGLPDNDVARYRVAAIMRRYHMAGHELSIEDGAAMAAQADKEEVLGRLSQLDPDQLLEYLGKDLRKVLRQAELKQVKASDRQKAANDNGRAPSSSSKQSGPAGVDWLGKRK